MGRKFFVGGNWKNNGTVESVTKLVEVLNAGDVPGSAVVEVVVAPTYVHIPRVQETLRKDFSVAAQNCWTGKGGAYTGEVSAEMLKDAGINWVILGHSERRALMSESNEVVGTKVAYALSQGLSIIPCVGETLEQREANATMSVVTEQLKAIADAVGDNWARVVIAYEPVWAIGTGKVATPEQAQEVHSEIRTFLASYVGEGVAGGVRILYGGSVSAKNARELAAAADIDGFLVGGASLKPEFIDVIKAAEASTP